MWIAGRAEPMPFEVRYVREKHDRARRWAVPRLVLVRAEVSPRARDADVVLPGAGPDLERQPDAPVLRGPGRPPNPPPSRPAAAGHLSIALNGQVRCHADLAVDLPRAQRWKIDEGAIVIDLSQGPAGGYFELQLARLVDVVDIVTRLFGIQRQIPTSVEEVRRLTSRGESCVGVFLESNLPRQARGNPGVAPLRFLRDAGYETFDFDGLEDLFKWQTRQGDLLAWRRDGVPDGSTVAALFDQRGFGLWVPRPSDRGGPLEVDRRQRQQLEATA